MALALWEIWEHRLGWYGSKVMRNTTLMRHLGGDIYSGAGKKIAAKTQREGTGLWGCRNDLATAMAPSWNRLSPKAKLGTRPTDSAPT